MIDGAVIDRTMIDGAVIDNSMIRNWIGGWELLGILSSARNCATRENYLGAIETRNYLR